MNMLAPETNTRAPRREAERLKTLAESLQKGGQSKGNEMVSGIVVKQSPLEHLARGLQTAAGGYFEGQSRLKEEEDERALQQRMADALSQWGDPQAAAGILAQDPRTSEMAMQLMNSEVQAQRDAQSRQAGYAREDAQWEKEAALKRELARMRQQGQGGYIDPETNEFIPPKPKLSATEQKEYFEADDRIAAGQNVVKNLESALSQNDAAYSGAMADERAWLVSNVGNLLGKETPSANATVDIKNLVSGQALEGLKTIFGGNPTEGERALLLELQASTEKTPAQRQQILQRGIEMANRRLERDRAIQGGLSTGTIYQNSPAQSVGTSTPQPSGQGQKVRQYLQSKGMAPQAIEQYLQSKGIQ